MHHNLPGLKQPCKPRGEKDSSAAAAGGLQFAVHHALRSRCRGAVHNRGCTLAGNWASALQQAAVLHQYRRAGSNITLPKLAAAFTAHPGVQVLEAAQQLVDEKLDVLLCKWASWYRLAIAVAAVRHTS